MVSEGISDNRKIVLLDYVALTVACREDDCTTCRQPCTDEWRDINIFGVNKSGVNSTKCSICCSLFHGMVLFRRGGIGFIGGIVA